MSRVRSVAVGLVAWCAVVAVVATLVWGVIGRAGAGLVPGAEPRTGATGSLPVPHHRSHRTSPHAHPSSHPTSRPPGRATSTATPGTGTSTGPAAPTSSAAAPPPSSSPPSSSTPTAERRSWSGEQGHVVAECRGTAARLVSAYPNTEWRYQILARGPSEVRVRFREVGGDDTVTVSAACVGGTPRFTTARGSAGDN